MREAHLEQIPHPPTKFGPRLSAFVQHMVRKVPDSRPTLARCAEVFAIDPKKDELARRRALSEAAAFIANSEAIEEAELLASAKLRQQRKKMYQQAKEELVGIRTRVLTEIRAVSESIKINGLGALEFGNAIFSIERNPPELNDLFKLHSAYKTCGWDVLSFGKIVLQTEGRGVTSYKWSASLLFGDRGDGSGFRWYEAAFFGGSFDHRGEPFGLDGDSPSLYLALSGGRTNVEIAYGPIAIDGENEPSFVDRWSELVAMAAVGKLSRSSGMALAAIKSISL